MGATPPAQKTQALRTKRGRMLDVYLDRNAVNEAARGGEGASFFV